MKQHTRDKDGSAFELGLQAESKFVTYMTSRGWVVRPSSLEENTDLHIDYHISKYGWGELSVDVKSEKKISRSDDKAQNELVWVEFKNGSGQAGWLYGSAELIAFQHEDEFILVSRFTLKNMVESKTIKEFVTNPRDALYRLYRRRGRQDLLTLVKLGDIKSIAIEKMDTGR